MHSAQTNLFPLILFLKHWLHTIFSCLPFIFFSFSSNFSFFLAYSTWSFSRSFNPTLPVISLKIGVHIFSKAFSNKLSYLGLEKGFIVLFIISSSKRYLAFFKSLTESFSLKYSKEWLSQIRFSNISGKYWFPDFSLL